MLEETDIFAGLPLKLGTAELVALPLPNVTLVAPFKGQMMAVADALQAEIGMILPPSGQCVTNARAKAYWRFLGQWLVFGEMKPGKLSGKAATVDMSDAFGRLRLTGGAAALSRLTELDIETMKIGQVAHTALADIPVTLVAIEGGFELMIPRSFSQSAVARLTVAMRSVAARGALG